MSNETLHLLRYNGTHVTLHLEDMEDVIVQYDESFPLDPDESKEINQFIEAIRTEDFYEVQLKLLAPVELDEIIGDNIYTLDIGPGILGLIVDKLMYMSHRTTRKLTHTGTADVVSKIGDVIDLEGIFMDIGGFKIPYIFDNEYLQDENIPRIRYTQNLVPLEHSAVDGTYFTKYTHSRGDLLILSGTANYSYMIPINKGIQYHDSLIDLLEFLDITVEAAFLEMLNK